MYFILFLDLFIFINLLKNYFYLYIIYFKYFI
jgi:hypothetical protein